jgi:glycosyltransferase involved in cell wall biosynthesis
MMYEGIVMLAVIVAGAMLIVVSLRLRHAFKATQPPRYTSSIAQEADLPSVTVCIPARNEQHALTECLERVLASTYQKLEIIVLDDVSGDDTSALIKSFASSGVRFVKGTALPQGWLGKNHALQGLLREASGTYLLFLDVDTRLSPYAIENMVRHSISKGAAMVSALPRREDGWRASVLFSPLRYFWSLLLHRVDQPAVASNAWLVRKSVLETEFDGFTSLKATVQPEATIAATLVKRDAYAFVVSDPLFGVSYEKKWRSQLITSLRLLYPLVGGSFIATSIVVIDLLIILIPWIVIITGIWTGFGDLQALSTVVALGYIVCYGIYTHRVWRAGWIVGALLWPYIVVQELVLLIISAIQYKRKAITWKGRLIRPVERN